MSKQHPEVRLHVASAYLFQIGQMADRARNLAGSEIRDVSPEIQLGICEDLINMMGCLADQGVIAADTEQIPVLGEAINWIGH